jgi:hypothetical protein
MRHCAASRKQRGSNCIKTGTKNTRARRGAKRGAVLDGIGISATFATGAISI